MSILAGNYLFKEGYFFKKYLVAVISLEDLKFFIEGCALRIVFENEYIFSGRIRLWAFRGECTYTASGASF